jgi:hypothetical protein
MNPMDASNAVHPAAATGDDGQVVDLRSAAGPGYRREWALFRDYTAATGQPTLPTTVAALTGFLTQVPARASTQGRRVAAIAAAHRNTGHLLNRPTHAHQPPRLDAGPEPGELLAACPTRGWPDGLLGRRDGFLIVLTAALGFPHTQARRIQPTDLTYDGEQSWRVEQRHVPVDADPRRCPSCALVRWLDILGIADGLGRGSARMDLTAAHAATALDPHQHHPAEPQRWSAAAQLLPPIDRHGWIDDYQPLSTRTIHTRLTHAATRATRSATPGDTNTAHISGTTRSAGRGEPPSPRTALALDEVLAQLDQVAADADALNARIEALLAPPHSAQTDFLNHDQK